MCETSLELRRKELQLKYSAKLIANLENPTGAILKECWQNRLTYYPHNKEPFAMKTREIYDIIGEHQNIQTNCYTSDPFWLRDSIHVDSTLSLKILKRKTGDDEAKKLGEKKIEQYSNTVKIYYRWIQECKKPSRHIDTNFIRRNIQEFQDIG